MKKRVLIIGGGAAGLMASIMAARNGAQVTLLEHNEKPGKKICATGNGKCNLTNLSSPLDAYRGSCPDFAKGALDIFSVQDTIRFFSELGIYTVNKNGYLYPHSGQASSVVDVLLMEARYRKVKIKTNAHVTEVRKEKGIWIAVTEGWIYEGDAIILANGSCASKIPGADGSGYAIAKQLGHKIIPPLPALTALKCKGNFAKWAGVRTDGAVTLCINGIPMKQERGELQLTEYGISGIPVFQLSRYAVRGIAEGCRITLLVDFLPEFTKEALMDFLERRRKNCPYKNQKELLVGLFSEKLIQVLSSEKDISMAIKEYPLLVTGGLDFDQAQICSGGVDTTQVYSDTMESMLHKGLYFAGELLDIDGTCGGYNLQWAWSSGAVAGCAVAKSVCGQERIKI